MPRLHQTALGAVLLVVSCGPPATPPETPHGKVGKVLIDDFATAASSLPPSPVGLVWADVDGLREGPAWEIIENMPEDASIPGASGLEFVREHIESIHTVAGGIWLTMTGQSILLVLETDLGCQELFEQVKAWAEVKKVPATSVKVRGRPALRTGDAVLVDAGDGVYINGPAGLAGRVLDLADRKVTGDAMSDQVRYLAQETIQDDAVLVVSGIAPPTSSEWLEAKHLPSVINARFLLAVQTPGEVSLRLGLLPGKSIKPIWFAQEVNTFLVRASKDQGIIDLGIAQWVENLDVELLGQGIVVKGSMEADRLSEVLKAYGGDK